MAINADFNHRLSIDSIQEAVALIDPVFLQSPQFYCDPLSDLFDLTLLLKVETMNPIRCFKGRGAEVLVSKAAPGKQMICASAGNFGQAMAYSCRKRKRELTVYASVNANPLKLARMRSLGATVVQHGEDFDSAKLEAKRRAREIDALFVEDGLDIETLEGAATIGLELLEYPSKIDIALIPLGNGALLNGVARVIKHYSPSTKVVAVQAQGASAMVESWRSSRVVNHESINTIADGIAVRLPIPQSIDDMRGLVDDALLVTEESIIEGMKLIHRHAGLVAEPSGAVGIAAIRENPDYFRHQVVATIICGGNVTEEQMGIWLT